MAESTPCGPTHHTGCACHEARHREEIARLTRERDLERAECRAWRNKEDVTARFKTGGATSRDLAAAIVALDAARAANQMEDTQ